MYNTKKHFFVITEHICLKISIFFRQHTTTWLSLVNRSIQILSCMKTLLFKPISYFFFSKNKLLLCSYAVKFALFAKSLKSEVHIWKRIRQTVQKWRINTFLFFNFTSGIFSLSYWSIFNTKFLAMKHLLSSLLLSLRYPKNYNCRWILISEEKVTLAGEESLSRMFCCHSFFGCSLKGKTLLLMEHKQRGHHRNCLLCQNDKKTLKFICPPENTYSHECVLFSLQKFSSSAKA